MSLRSFAYRHLQRLIGSRMDRAWRELHAEARLSPEAFAAARDRQLRAALEQARATTPFYRDRAAGLDPGTLSTFPVLDKTTLIGSFRALMSPHLCAEYEGGKPRGYGWVEVRSGGTTGTPVAVIHGPDFRDHDRALRMYQMELCGFPFGTPYFRLWGSMRDINQMKDSRAHRVMTALAGERVLNAFQMEAADMDRYLDAMRSSGIRYLMAYIDAAVQLAHHARRRGDAPRLESIMACAGTVTDEARSVLREVFGARVHNKYGSRDAGEIACECAHGGLHILPGVVVEAVDDAGAACAPGVSGRLLITSLHNRDFPIIRYEIGDVGALSDRLCPCGLPFPLMERLEGRAVEFLRSATGGYISPVYIRHLIGVVHPPAGLVRYQMEQMDARRFILRLEREAGAPGLTEAALAPLRRDLFAVLGAEAELAIEDVPRIAESASGKFLYILNRAPRG